MKLIIDIPEETVNEIKDNAMFADTIPSEILWDVTSAIVNGVPHETVTEFADRCRECGREKVLDKIMDEVCDIDDEIVLNPDSIFDRKAYVRLNKVMDIINKYRGESKDASID